jgi:glutathione S-transferase
MPYKLVYFKLRGRAQTIRYICKDNGLELEEELVTDEAWPKLKPNTPFGQLPVFYDGTTVLAQSNAIIRYLARKHGLYGKNDTEATQIDMLNDQEEDLRLRYVILIYQQYDTHKDEFIKDLPTQLAIFEKSLKKNHDGTGFFVGTQISFADYSIFELLDNLQVLSPKCLQNFPLLKAFHSRIANREKLLRYRQSDAFKSLPINGNGKQ